jgi:hypothetical protein
VKLTPNEVTKLRHLGHAEGLLPVAPVERVPMRTKYSLARKGAGDRPAGPHHE